MTMCKPHIELLRESSSMASNQRVYTGCRMVASTAAKAGSTRLRFFAGLPLKGSSGHKLGDLMLVDAQPRRITAEKKAILANMAGEAYATLATRSP